MVRKQLSSDIGSRADFPRRRQLEKDDPSTDVPVTKVDQDRINQFSRLNSRTDEIVDVLDGLRKQKEDLEEIETEMELVDEDEVVMCVSARWGGLSGCVGRTDMLGCVLLA